MYQKSLHVKILAYKVNEPRWFILEHYKTFQVGGSRYIPFCTLNSAAVLAFRYCTYQFLSLQNIHKMLLYPATHFFLLAEDKTLSLEEYMREERWVMENAAIAGGIGRRLDVMLTSADREMLKVFAGADFGGKLQI